MNFFSSTGIKRLLSAIISMMASVVASVPELMFLTPILAKLSAFLGLVGTVQGVTVGTIVRFKLTTLASVVAVLIAVAQQVPQLTPYVPLLQMIAAALGGAAVTQSLNLTPTTLGIKIKAKVKSK